MTIINKNLKSLNNFTSYISNPNKSLILIYDYLKNDSILNCLTRWLEK